MIDRIIGLIGVALALILGLWSLAPSEWPKMPTWATLIGMFVGVLLVGIAVGLYFGGGKDNPYAVVTAKIPTFVSVRFDTPDNPINIGLENVSRWYFLKNGVVIKSIDPKTQESKQETITVWNLFIVFQKPIAIKQLRITGGPSLPSYEVKVADPVHAIVVFSGDLTGKTVTAEALL